MSAQTDRRTVVAALSGGVDSAVAAARLVEEGLAVVGMTLRLRTGQEKPDVPTTQAIERARSVSRQLGIPFHVTDAQEAFRRKVVDYFITEYAAGRTPNPCVRCNRFIRFGLQMDRARALGADLLATGHYARIRRIGATYQLLRGCDANKDQSYFLHILTQDQLAHTSFPVGRLTKGEVRELAKRYGLPVAEQAESHDVCFLADGDYRRFLAEEAPELMQPGPIRDSAGRLLGEHCGLGAYTVGQRKGLRISSPQPLYVLTIEPEENTIIVGRADELGQHGCLVESMQYVGGGVRNTVFRADAQIRYRSRPACVTVRSMPGARATVQFDEPQRGITPGQYLVLYEGEVVLGGGVICEARAHVL